MVLSEFMLLREFFGQVGMESADQGNLGRADAVGGDESDESDGCRARAGQGKVVGPHWFC